MDSFLPRLPFLAAVWWIFVVIRRVSEQVECIGLRATFPHLEPSSIERNLASIIHCMGISQNNFTTDVDLRRREFYRVQSFLAQQLKGMRIRGHCYAGHCGPWLEDIWRSQFSFDDVAEFGVFVPLFVPWLYLWLEHGHWYSRFLPTFANFLSRDFLYITMSQNDDGVEGQNERLLPDNVFVISAGGKGNVPFLLLGKPYSPLPDGDPILYDVVLMGSLNNHWIRPIIAESMPKLFNHSYLKSSPDWVSKYRSSKVVLCPRG